MRIFRHIAPHDKDAEWEVLSRLGIERKPGLGCFEFPEDDPRWPQLLALGRELHIITSFCQTEFTEDERASADYLEFRPTWVNGDPQPDKNYEQKVFDMSRACTACWRGRVQTAPFRLKKEPNWRRQSFFSPHWTFGEVFVKEDVYEQVFKPAGVDCWPVLLNRKETVIPGVVQLKAMESVVVDTIGIRAETCRICGALNYRWPSRGLQPMPYHATAPVVASTQTFGAGLPLTMVSQGIYQQLKKLKGVLFSPCSRVPYDPSTGIREID